jgi:hypothetical protein
MIYVQLLFSIIFYANSGNWSKSSDKTGQHCCSEEAITSDQMLQASFPRAFRKGASRTGTAASRRVAPQARKRVRSTQGPKVRRSPEMGQFKYRLR